MSNKKPVSSEELLLAQMYAQDALIKVLIKKGLITEAEIMDEIIKSKQKLKKSDETH